MIALNFGTVAGLTGPEQKALDELVRVYSLHQAGNAEKEKYYEGHVALKDVNLGIALPQGIRNLEIGCSWGQKAVDVLAARSMFDGFVSSSGDNAVLNRLIADNRLIAEYGKACRDELKYGCAFATLSADAAIGCKIRFHSPATAAALWSGEKGRIACGLAIIDTVPDEHLTGVWQPRVVNLYMDNAVTVLRRRQDGWNVQRMTHAMGRPLMEPLIWNATSGKPFGRSRLKRSIRTLIDDYIRTVANATIALEFDTTPQKYILGVTDEQYDVLISDKFKSYVGSLLAATSNPETGENPVFGQLAQGSLSPHTEKMRMTATQFAAATGLTVTDVGVVNDANPTSSDAILAQSQTLVLLAQQLNTGNGDALRTIAQMAQAILRNVPPGALTDYAAALVQKYGEGSAELACQMYDAMAALQNARVSPAEPAAPASRREVARMVLATRESPPQMQRGVSRLVKRAGADTTLKNAQRDGAEFAWVPHGDSCAFCLTLASRGWQRASQAAIKGGHAEHIHANCDCEYAVRFDGRTSVAGYDPEAYLAQYNAAGGDINRMRRVDYAANKERINAQKRAAYEARKIRGDP